MSGTFCSLKRASGSTCIKLHAMKCCCLQTDREQHIGIDTTMGVDAGKLRNVRDLR